MAEAIQPAFRQEVTELTGRFVALTDAARPLFGRIGVARQGFTADEHAVAIEAAAFDTTEEVGE